MKGKRNDDRFVVWLSCRMVTMQLLHAWRSSCVTLAGCLRCCGASLAGPLLPCQRCRRWWGTCSLRTWPQHSATAGGCGCCKSAGEGGVLRRGDALSAVGPAHCSLEVLGLCYLMPVGLAARD